MEIHFRYAKPEDAELLVEIYTASFYRDYLEYGECPGYGKTKEMMVQSIKKFPKWIILSDGKPVGAISVQSTGKGCYEVGCLCVIPEYQGKGIGTKALQYAQSYYDDWEIITLVTPAGNTKNVSFYTNKCGFRIASEKVDGNVRLFRFIKERHSRYSLTIPAGDFHK